MKRGNRIEKKFWDKSKENFFLLQMLRFFGGKSGIVSTEVNYV